MAHRDNVSSPGFEAEQGVEGDHPKDMSQGDLQALADIVQRPWRHIVVLGVDALEHRDQGRPLALILVEELIHLLLVFKRDLRFDHLHRRGMDLVLHRAVQGAFLAAGTLARIHVAGLLQHRNREVPCLSLNVQHLRVGQEVDVGVAEALDHLGGQDAHGAVVGGKGLVQLRHPAADTGSLLHQVDAKPHVRKVDGCLNPGDTATYYRYSSTLHVRHLPVPPSRD